MALRGKSLELFFIDGTPDGMLTAEIFNWTGHILMAPRIRLAEALERKESNYTGAYILLGNSEDSSLDKAYIGQGDDIGNRIRFHDAAREWWTHAVLITSTANSLNSAHARYLESRLIAQAKRSGSMIIENQQSPALPILSESSTANMEQFVEHVLTILPALRVDGFTVKTRSTPAVLSSDGQRQENKDIVVFEMRLASGEVNATAHLQNGEFVVQPGSLGRAKWIGVDHNYAKLFDEVVKSGAYLPDGDGRVFVKAYAFSSPSAAGAVLSGRATAGPITWFLSSEPRTSYKQWESNLLRR